MKCSGIYLSLSPQTWRIKMLICVNLKFIINFVLMQYIYCTFGSIWYEWLLWIIHHKMKVDRLCKSYDKILWNRRKIATHITRSVCKGYEISLQNGRQIGNSLCCTSHDMYSYSLKIIKSQLPFLYCFLTG